MHSRLDDSGQTYVRVCIHVPVLLRGGGVVPEIRKKGSQSPTKLSANTQLTPPLCWASREAPSSQGEGVFFIIHRRAVGLKIELRWPLLRR